jgi:peptidoglycan/xylan/chitin deacetylase (PgdA/CDA1 family)
VSSALAITYHEVGAGPAPLCTGPELLREQLDCLAALGANTLTISELAEGLRRNELPERAVALTFDDGFKSTAEVVAPMMVERGMRATVFCVAGHLGGLNEWPSQRAGAPRRPLVDLQDLRDLAAAGFEIGSHGMEHAPLAVVADEQARRELVDSRSLLEQTIGVPVHSFAYPYGSRPRPAARALIEHTYTTACDTRVAVVDPGADLFALPRVDAHYLRRPAVLQRAVAGSLGHYLRARRLGSRARRYLRSDYLRVEETAT